MPREMNPTASVTSVPAKDLLTTLSPRQAMKFRGKMLRTRTAPVRVDVWNRWRSPLAAPLGTFPLNTLRSLSTPLKSDGKR